jgi:hypothetical protein
MWLGEKDPVGKSAQAKVIHILAMMITEMSKCQVSACCILIGPISQFGSCRSIIPLQYLRNRAVRVALSLLPEADLSTTPMDPTRILPVNVPTGDPDNLQSRLAAKERMLQDLSLKLADPPSQTPVGPSPGPASPHGILVRNRRYDTVLSVNTYRRRDQTSALRPDKMISLSSTAALIRPRLEGSFFSGSPSLGILPFWPRLSALPTKPTFLKRLYFGYWRIFYDHQSRNHSGFKLTTPGLVPFTGF